MSKKEPRDGVVIVVRTWTESEELPCAVLFYPCDKCGNESEWCPAEGSYLPGREEDGTETHPGPCRHDDPEHLNGFFWLCLVADGWKSIEVDGCMGTVSLCPACAPAVAGHVDWEDPFLTLDELVALGFPVDVVEHFTNEAKELAAREVG